MKKLRAPFKTHGGKFYLSPWIIENFPPNYENIPYLELFGGAGNVLLNKRKSVKEIYNDLHQPTSNIFTILVNSGDELIKCISDIEYSETVFEEAKKASFHYNTVNSAINEIILRRMSRGGMKKAFSWSTRTRGGKPGDINAWETFKKLLPSICNRLKEIEVFSVNAVNLIETHIKENCLIYLDPPYVANTRTAKSVYDCEMTDENHQKLAELANLSKSFILISGYDCPLYRHFYKNWNWLAKEVPNHSGQGVVKQKRIEYLIKNY